ncbi:UNVERIFIED_CONTAM: hypothetical protein HDU68_005657, partial [Siphonaria sp. JEL0065]
SDPVSIVKSIVWDLVQNVGSLLPEFKKNVLKQLDDDQYQVKYYNKPSILLDPFKAFQLLIIDGLKNDTTCLDKTVLIVIDALDECNFKTRSSLLKVLTNLSPLLPSFLKIFVTARPEKDIYDCLTTLSVVELEPSQQDNLQDIKLVVENRFRNLWNIASDENLSDAVAACVSNLVAKSEGLFIYVRAVCEFLEQNSFTPTAAREQIEAFKSGPDEVYTLIAKKASEVIGANIFESVLGCMLFANEPLDVPSLSFMASLSVEKTQTIVDQLRSILKISDGRVSIIHKSIKDYFSTPQRSNQYFIHLETATTLLAAGCLAAVSSILDTLSTKPARDLVNLLAGKPSSLTVSNLSVEGSKSLAAYALGNWANHLETTSNGIPIELPPQQRAVAMTSAVVLNKANVFVKISDANSIPAFLQLKYFASPPLYEAAKRGLTPICKALLETKLVDVNCVGYSPAPQLGEKENTPLIIATLVKSLPTVEVLVDFGADISAQDSSGNTALAYSPASGEIHLFLQQQQRTKKMNIIQETMSPLQKAVWKQDLTAVKSELVAGSNFLIPNPSDSSNVLHYAAEFFDATIFALLLSQFKSSVNDKNATKMSKVKRSDLFHFLFIVKMHPFCIVLSMIVKLANVARLRRKNGAWVNAENVKKRTPLHLAAQNGHTDAARLLLDNGANVNAENANKLTPLHNAALNGHVDVARLLLKNGARVNAETVDKSTPLHFAAVNGHVDSARLFLDKGANVNAENAINLTPLHNAALHGHVDVLRLLLDHGANVNAENVNMVTVLDCAKVSKMWDVGNLLLEYMAKLKTQDDHVEIKKD